MEEKLYVRAEEAGDMPGIHRLVVVIGNPGYYPRFGFIPSRAQGLEVSWPVPDEAFMAAEPAPGALEGIRGEVVFPPAFDEAM